MSEQVDHAEATRAFAAGEHVVVLNSYRTTARPGQVVAVDDATLEVVVGDIHMTFDPRSGDDNRPDRPIWRGGPQPRLSRVAREDDPEAKQVFALMAQRLPVARVNELVSQMSAAFRQGDAPSHDGWFSELREQVDAWERAWDERDLAAEGDASR